MISVIPPYNLPNARIDMADTDVSSGADTPSSTDEIVTFVQLDDLSNKLRKEESAECRKLKEQLNFHFHARKEELDTSLCAREKELVEKQDAFAAKEKERVAALVNLQELEAVLRFRKTKADEESVNLHVLRQTFVTESAKTEQEAKVKTQETIDRMRKQIQKEATAQAKETERRLARTQGVIDRRRDQMEEDATVQAKEHADKTSDLLAWEHQLHKLAQELKDREDSLQAQYVQKTTVSPPHLSVLEGLKVEADGKVYNDAGVAIGVCLSGDIYDMLHRKCRIDGSGNVINRRGEECGKCSVLAVKEGADNATC